MDLGRSQKTIFKKKEIAVIYLMEWNGQIQKYIHYDTWPIFDKGKNVQQKSV